MLVSMSMPTSSSRCSFDVHTIVSRIVQNHRRGSYQAMLTDIVLAKFLLKDCPKELKLAMPFIFLRSIYFGQRCCLLVIAV